MEKMEETFKRKSSSFRFSPQPKHLSLPDRFLGVKERSRFGPKIKITSDANVAKPLKVLQIDEPAGVVGVGPGQIPEDLFEEQLVAGDR